MALVACETAALAMARLALAARLPIGSESARPTDASGKWFSAIVPYERPVAPSTAGGTASIGPLKPTALGLSEPARPRRW